MLQKYTAEEARQRLLNWSKEGGYVPAGDLCPGDRFVDDDYGDSEEYLVIDTSDCSELPAERSYVAFPGTKWEQAITDHVVYVVNITRGYCLETKLRTRLVKPLPLPQELPSPESR